MSIPLHVHSSYSLLEGASSLEAIVRRAVECGYAALALTDTNNLYGAVKFVALARRHGLRPLLGACLRQGQRRCVALIADASGYSSLCRILSRLNLPDQTGDLIDLLAGNAQGLHVLVDDPDMAERLREPFGRRLWLEVVRPSRSAEREKNLLARGRELGLLPVATSAAHFATPADYPAFRLITSVRQGILLDQLPARLPITPSHHLIDANTYRQRFDDLPEALVNADLLAEELDSNVLPSARILPPARVPRQWQPRYYLQQLCERGLRQRGLDHAAARQRLREELTVIDGAGLAGYFLVVRDIARYAQRRGYGMALRGSAGNSLACYLLHVTNVDPLRFNLPMERFLHPGRADLPDIDLDFDWKVRDDVIAYVFRRYGAAHTAMISSHLFLQPRSAFREAAKIHGLSNDQISRLIETLPVRVSGLLGDDRDIPEDQPTPRGFPLEPERWPRILADGRLLAGRPHHLSIHPGGVVITPGPIEDHVPLQYAPKGIVITQFEKDAAEETGLVKIDLLGNRALSTVDDSLRATGLRGVLDPDPEDALAVDLLLRGDTLGVNQLESPAMRHLIIQMKARCLDDVIQSLALVRPGAASIGAKEAFIRRRRGLEKVRHVHPVLEPVLNETQGLIVFEDDSARVVQAMTGWSGPQADLFRKRIGKHRTVEEGARLGVEFTDACGRMGIPRAAAVAQWEQLAKFNLYSFCKSHAVSYGLIGWTAIYMKAHHPVHFWTAALNNNQGMYPRRVYVEAAKRADIAFRLPCVNVSEEAFTVEEGAIRVGLEAIASLDEEVRGRLLAERARAGVFQDLADFRRRVAPGPDALALLIGAGALDVTGKPRPALFLEADLQDRLNDPKDSGRPRLFADDGDLGWEPGDYPPRRRLQDEWDHLGFIVGPPLMSLYRGQLPQNLHTSRDLPALVGKTVRVAGVVATSRHTETNDGRPMQFITLEDEWGLIEVTLFPGSCEPLPHLALGPYLVTGVVDVQHDVLTVTAKSFRREVLKSR